MTKKKQDRPSKGRNDIKDKVCPNKECDGHYPITRTRSGRRRCIHCFGSRVM